jgi:hypothetical protein
VAVQFLEGAAIELTGRDVPVTAMKGAESRKALASEIGKLAEPGPHEVKVAVGWPDTR